MALLPSLSTPALHRDHADHPRRRDPRTPTTAAAAPTLNATKTLPTLASTSTAAIGTVDSGVTALPPQKMRYGAAFFDQVVPLKPEASSSADVADGEDAHAPRSTLTRTQSQLTFLLERDRQLTRGDAGGGSRRRRKGSI